MEILKNNWKISLNRHLEVVLEAGAIDVLVADTPALKKDAWAVHGSIT